MSLETLESAGAPGDSAIAREVRSLGPWFHNLHLPGGVQTAPDHPLGDFPRFKWRQVASVLPADLTGWTVLDIGCNAGFYSFELARRGAEVLGIDADPRYLRQAEWARRHLDDGGRVRFEQRTVYDLPLLADRFDLVLFMGVLYHLRYPLLALEMVAEKVDRLLIFQTLSLPGDEVLETPPDLLLQDRRWLLQPGWPSMAFVEGKMAGDPTNWWVPNLACSEALLRSAGLRVTARPGDEMFCCEPVPGRPAAPYRQALPALAPGPARGER
ncbi:MAG TPA: TIGR04290 family methyltransferase [Thermoanaerobaculia bacterium]|nr:TIGR04290 family methyltransferase [Thermoanaerobaculia bacterium]